MTTLLQIQSGIFGGGSQSNKLSDLFVGEYQRANPGTTVVRRDLAAHPLPHLDGEILSAFMTPANEHTQQQRQAAGRSDDAIAELQAADVLVIGLPMYNFSVPSTLKAWIDHVARAGITFRYTENGPQGLLSDKKVFVLAARGGVYGDTGNDHQTPYVRQLLGFLGLEDVTFIYAEGLNLGQEVKEQALKLAGERISEVVAQAVERRAA
jgi:FMN-dependent NADH-azoreductase